MPEDHLASDRPVQLPLVLADRIKRLRKQIRLTRRGLSRQTGISERYLADLESGKANISIGLLVRVTDALGTSVAAILAGQDDVSVPYEPLRALLRRLTLDQQKEIYQLLSKRLGDDTRLKGVALIGLRGAGKSTLGATLAQATQTPFIRLSRKVEQLAGMSVGELMELGGEKTYRRYELMALKKIVEGDGKVVLEVSGGLVCEVETFDYLMKNFKVIWLKARPEEHMTRVIAQGDMRPMAGNAEAIEDLKAMLRAREADYSRADYVLNTTGRNIDTCLRELIEVNGPILR